MLSVLTISVKTADLRSSKFHFQIAQNIGPKSESPLLWVNAISTAVEFVIGFLEPFY